MLGVGMKIRAGAFLEHKNRGLCLCLKVSENLRERYPYLVLAINSGYKLNTRDGYIRSVTYPNLTKLLYGDF